jgi:hypothetical protein
MQHSSRIVVDALLLMRSMSALHAQIMGELTSSLERAIGVSLNSY